MIYLSPSQESPCYWHLCTALPLCSAPGRCSRWFQVTNNSSVLLQLYTACNSAGNRIQELVELIEAMNLETLCR